MSRPGETYRCRCLDGFRGAGAACLCVRVYALRQKGKASQQNIEINTDTTQIEKNYLDDGPQMISASESVHQKTTPAHILLGELRPTQEIDVDPPCSLLSSPAFSYHTHVQMPKEICLSTHLYLRRYRWPRECRRKKKRTELFLDIRGFKFLFLLLLLFIVINIHFILLLLQVLEYIVVVANLW